MVWVEKKDWRFRLMVFFFFFFFSCCRLVVVVVVVGVVVADGGGGCGWLLKFAVDFFFFNDIGELHSD